MIAVGRQGRTYIDAVMTWSAMMAPVVDRGHSPAYRAVLSVGWCHPYPVSGRCVHPVRRINMHPMGNTPGGKAAKTDPELQIIISAAAAASAFFMAASFQT